MGVGTLVSPSISLTAELPVARNYARWRTDTQQDLEPTLLTESGTSSRRKTDGQANQFPWSPNIL